MDQIHAPKADIASLVFVALWLAGAVTCYISTHWHSYFGTPPWLSGVASILVVAPVPLAVTLLAERTTTPIISQPVPRILVAGALGVLVTLGIQQPLAWRVAEFVVHLTR